MPELPPPIGSAAWDRELVALGLDRATVDQELAWAVEDTPEPDGHDVYLTEPTPVTAAVLVLFHQEHPSYSALMYLRFVWNHCDEQLRAWIVRQYAAMLLHGPHPVAESGEYGLEIDYFEYPDGPDVLAALLTQMPTDRWGPILSASGPILWPEKQSLYAAAARIPELHAPLAIGIAVSLFGYYGQADVPAAAELLDRITVADDEIRTRLVDAITKPMLMRSGSAIVVTDARWNYPGSFLLTMTVTGGPRMWKARSELVIDGQVRGRVAHWSSSFRPEYEHRVLPGRPLDKPGLHRIEPSSGDAAEFVDRDVEIWPEGLRAYLARDDRPA